MHTIPRLARWLFALALFFLALMSLLRIAAFAAFAPPGFSFGQAANALWLGFRYDAREAGILCLLLLLLALVPALDPFRQKAGRILQFSLIAIFIIALLVLYVFDFLHFRYLLQRLNASALSLLQDAKLSGAMVWQTYPVIRILLAMVIAFIILFWLVRLIFKKVSATVFRGSAIKKYIFETLVFLLCALAIFGRIGQYPLRWSDAFDLGSDFQANLSLNPFQSFFSSLSFRHSGYVLQKVKDSYPIVSAYLGVDRPDSATLNYDRNVAAPAAATHPNVVLVICESFSAYKSSMWGNPLNATPFFDQLCRQGLFFDNCFTPSYGTARGVWATLTGIADVESNPNKTSSRNPAAVDQHTIANDFTGYNKFYFLGGSTSWANIRGVLSNNIKGLRIYEQDDYKAPKVDVWGISDHNLFTESGQLLNEKPQPFLAIIQTADNHRPYTIPKEDRGNFQLANLPVDTLRKYGFESNDEYNAFRFTDFCFASFIEQVKKESWFNNTIFAFIGDHGIGGNAGAFFPRAWSDDGLTRNHVPLLFYSPALVKPARIHSLASQVDVLPTLASLANISYRNTTLGRDLLGQLKADSGKSNLAFIYDANNQDVGIIKGQWFYSRNQQGSQEKLRWADFNQAEQPVNKDSLLAAQRKLTEAFYETSKYLLLNNKKKP